MSWIFSTRSSFWRSRISAARCCRASQPSPTDTGRFGLAVAVDELELVASSGCSAVADAETDEGAEPVAEVDAKFETAVAAVRSRCARERVGLLSFSCIWMPCPGARAGVLPAITIGPRPSGPSDAGSLIDGSLSLNSMICTHVRPVTSPATHQYRNKLCTHCTSKQTASDRNYYVTIWRVLAYLQFV